MGADPAEGTPPCIPHGLHPMDINPVECPQLDIFNHTENHTDRRKRSYQCPPYSCWIPVIPVDSGGIPLEFTSQNFTPATKLCNSGIYTGMVPRVQSPEWHQNPLTRIELKMPNTESLGFSHEKW